jgi:hypothetical protein
MIHRSIRTIAALLSIGFLLPACRGPVLGMLGRQVESAMRANRPAELPDGLHVLLCGAGGPMPDPKRSGPCVAIIAGESVVMIDSGSGAARNLVRFGLQPGLVEAVFLTHFHSDHIDGLGEVATLRWVGAGWTTPLLVFGPEGSGGSSMASIDPIDRIRDIEPSITERRLRRPWAPVSKQSPFLFPRMANARSFSRKAICAS